MTIAPQPGDGTRPGPTVRVHVTESTAPADPATDSEKPDRDRAFTAFMESHADDLLRTAWFLSGDAHRAEELVQQALVRTYTAWHRAAATDPLAYARRILVNQRIDTWRRRRREVLSEPSDLAALTPAGRDEHASADDRDQLTRALAMLSPRARRIVVLRHLVGLPEAEVAASLGISVGTVKSTASRGLATLRATLTETERSAS
ncbi:SigE family RNA polymerase sigma factor [Luteimicrobium sp. DT211]|uniref:SigE family RNA polymerase sigma factor n=1 Tax=Luteimicrobium sp. DT211 TaxID=3393412 RepID=UPI003CEF389C